MDRRLGPFRTWFLVAPVFVLVAMAFTFPLILRGGSAFPHDAGDPALNTWLLWWSTTRLPLSTDWWNAAMFYPSRNVMALSELLIGLLPITAPVQWVTGNPLLAYNVAFFLSFPLCGLAAYLLALELTGRRDVSILAGLVFAFGPYRMNELSHLQMLSYYWAPVALWALHRYLRDPRVQWLVVFAGAWLMQSLSNGYALFHLSVLIVLWLIWFVRDIRRMVPILMAWGGALLVMSPALLEYRTAHVQFHLARDINEVQQFSTDLAGFLSAPPELALWGGRLLPSQYGTAMFPGITVAILLIAGVAYAIRHRRPSTPNRSTLRRFLAVVSGVCVLIALSALIVGPWSIGPVLTVSNFHKPFSLAVLFGLLWFGLGDRWRRVWREASIIAFYVLAAAVMYLLALGPSPTFLGRQILYEPPYAWLMRLPGFDVLRVPARFGMPALLCQAVIVALIAARWLSANTPRRRLALTVIGIGLLADGWVFMPLIAAPTASAAPFEALKANGARAVIELPVGEAIVDFPAMYHSMAHRLPVANGFSGFAPPHYLPLVQAVNHERYAALEALAQDGPLGVAVDRSLVWHEGIEKSLAQFPGARAVSLDDRWATFLVAGTGKVEMGSFLAIPIARVRANRQETNVGRMIDGMVTTAWGPETPQDGTEEVVVEIEPAQPVGGIVLSMGSYSFGFPRELAVDLSNDGTSWLNVWQGETSVATVRAAIAYPTSVPLAIDFEPSPAKFVRLRQLGHDDRVPWWIAEVWLHGSSALPGFRGF